MGFRSTFTTIDVNIAWPDWFVEKYKENILFRSGNKGSIQSNGERKIFGTWDNLLKDIQTVLRDVCYDDWFCLVFLHEDEKITKCYLNVTTINTFVFLDDYSEFKNYIWDREPVEILE